MTAPLSSDVAGTNAPHERELPSFPGLADVTPLGAGATGTVFRARQVELGRDVAVKVLHRELRADPDVAERFTREARILATLEHPGIVAVHYAGSAECGPYYVMSLVAGETVERALARRTPLEVARVFAVAAHALAEAHRRGVLHRDVKPENLLLTEDGRPVWVDFGLASSVHVPSSNPSGEPLCGTPDYLAPELVDGEPASVASDVYALGATLYRVLVGSVPFPASTLTEKLRAIREDDPPLLCRLRPEIPAELQAICFKALERAPLDRYASAAEFALDLERFVAGDAVLGLPRRAQRLLRRKIELHLGELEAWRRDGLLDDASHAELERAYERAEERRRALLAHVFGSLTNVLLLVGVLLSVFGPVVLLLATWEQQSHALRVGLPLAPLVTLAAFAITRRRARDARGALACWLGVALLVVPTAFSLADLVPALRTVVDDDGVVHPVVPGPMWLAGDDAPAWHRAGSALLEWKLMLTSLATLAVALVLQRRLRAAAFLWIACLAGLGFVVCGALRAGFGELPVGARWSLVLAGAFATAILGGVFERRLERERAFPFYGFGFLAFCVAALHYTGLGVPARLWLAVTESRAEARLESASALVHGLLATAAGLWLHFRGSPLRRALASPPLLFGFALTFGAAASYCVGGSFAAELAWIATSLGYLLLGLALHRNALVLPAALALPMTVGTVSQRHVDGLWAWSTAIVLGGALLVALSFRLRRKAEAAAG